VLTTTYRPGVTAHLGDVGVPTGLIAQARDSVGGALQVAADLRLAAGIRASVASTARTEFVHADSHSRRLDDEGTSSVAGRSTHRNT
jgi:hypothetical protein